MSKMRPQDLDDRDFSALISRLESWGAWARRESEGNLRAKCITGELIRRANGVIIDPNRDYICPATDSEALKMERHLAKLKTIKRRYYVVIDLMYREGLQNRTAVAERCGKDPRTIKAWHEFAMNRLYEMGA